MSPNDVISTQEAASILGRSVGFVKYHAMSGRLPARKLPGRTGAYVFSRRDVERLRDELEAEAS